MFRETSRCRKTHENVTQSSQIVAIAEGETMGVKVQGQKGVYPPQKYF